MDKILVIKLGALGDVVRTVPLAKALKKKYPGSVLHWVTKENAKSLLEKNPDIDKIFSIPFSSEEKYDYLYNFDMEEEATEVASSVEAGKKYGFYREGGYPLAFNFPAEYYLNTLFDDELKKSNRKTYQEMMFEVAEIPYDKERGEIYLSEEDKSYAKNFLESNGLVGKKIVGIHIGASPRWPSKVWDEDKVKEFISMAKNKGYEVILFGGPNEKERHGELVDEFGEKGIKIYRNNPDNTLREFASLVNLCENMICSDSLSLHVAIALGKSTVGLFFCTPPYEVEGYGLLKKIVSPMLNDFFPERMDQYSKELTESISAADVIAAIEEKRVVNAVINQNGKLLLIKRKKSDNIHPGKWAFPGGVVESGEDTESALKREIFEETGLRVNRVVRKLSEYGYSERIGECFLVESEGFHVSLGEEVAEFRWASLEDFEGLDHIDGLEEEAFSAICGEAQNNKKPFGQ